MPSRPSSRHAKTAACTCSPSSVERRARDHAARRRARGKSSLGQPQLEPGAALAAVAVVDGGQPGVLDGLRLALVDAARRCTRSSPCPPPRAAAGRARAAHGRRRTGTVMLRMASSSSQAGGAIGRGPRCPGSRRACRRPPRARGTRAMLGAVERDLRRERLEAQLEAARQRGAQAPSPSLELRPLAEHRRACVPSNSSVVPDRAVP